MGTEPEVVSCTEDECGFGQVRPQVRHKASMDELPQVFKVGDERPDQDRQYRTLEPVREPESGAVTIAQIRLRVSRSNSDLGQQLGSAGQGWRTGSSGL